MPRHKKERCCRALDGELIYKPISVPLCDLEEVVIELDEFEAIRLCDLEGLKQDEAGHKMGVSRGTVQRLVESGHRKLVQAFLNSAAITIKNSIPVVDSTPSTSKEDNKK